MAAKRRFTSEEAAMEILQDIDNEVSEISFNGSAKEAEDRDTDEQGIDSTLQSDTEKSLDGDDSGNCLISFFHYYQIPAKYLVFTILS